MYLPSSHAHRGAPAAPSPLRRHPPPPSRTEDIVQSNRPQSSSQVVRGRRPWVAPVVANLPRLTDLTLTTGGPIPGMGDTGSGSTVTP